MKRKITLTGDLGAGKSTIGKLLVEKTGATFYSTGFMCREIAKKHGVDVLRMNEYMKEHPEIDYEIDDFTASLSNKDENMIIDSRLAWHFTKGSCRVYLSCSLDECARRAFTRQTEAESYASVEEAKEKLYARRQTELQRYKDFYHINYGDLNNYSIVVDTTYATPFEVTDAILSFAEEYDRNPNAKKAYICPSRLFYPEDGAPLDEVSNLADKLDVNEDIPEVTVFYEDGEFYVKDGVASALAYSLCDEIYVPCHIVDGHKEGVYVQMKNNLVENEEV